MEEPQAPIEQPVAEVAEAPVKVKAKRQPSAYNLFIKDTYKTLTDVPTNERFKRCSELWKEKKQKDLEEASKPKKKARAKKAKK
tara:strand:- start:990 stop:1241 length:252 start_codon:yes stop_codon:yes gene_type:complete